MRLREKTPMSIASVQSFRSGWLGCAVCAMLSFTAPAEPAPPRDPVHDEASSKALRFFTDQSVVWLGKTQLLPFQRNSAHSMDGSLAGPVDQPEILEIVSKPSTFNSETMGFVRV